MIQDRAKEVKLLAPAGSFAALHTALQAGCDEVYFGVEKLNMRVGARKNFKLEDLPEIVRLCREKRVKCYLVLNTVLYDEDLTEAYRIIDEIRKTGVNGIIAMDLAAILYARKVGLEVHVSVQAGISNLEAVRFYSRWSDRLVLARELDLPKQKYICEQIRQQEIRGPSGRLVEIEVFAHGALCVSVSGKCGMSLLTYNKSANRGECIQPCRRRYKVIDVETDREMEVEDQYIMSSQDLCTIGFLDELVATGITVLKIEGRNKPPEYVDTVIRTYREALDSLANNDYTEEKILEWNERLGTVYNRGLSSGYYLGKKFKDWSGIYGSKATKEKVYVGLVTHYFPKARVAEIKIEAEDLSIGDEYLIIGNTSGTVRGEVAELRNNEQETIKLSNQGELVSFPVDSRVRENDKVYKFVDRKKKL